MNEPMGRVLDFPFRILPDQSPVYTHLARNGQASKDARTLKAVA